VPDPLIQELHPHCYVVHSHRSVAPTEAISDNGGGEDNPTQMTLSTDAVLSSTPVLKDPSIEPERLSDNNNKKRRRNKPFPNSQLKDDLSLTVSTQKASEEDEMTNGTPSS